MWLLGKRKPMGLVAIRAVPRPQIDVVFVHGLDGDARSTWRFDESPSWHDWISAAVPAANIWSLAYRLRSSKWSGGSMALSDRAINTLAVIDVELTAPRPLVFVCHSYGGLLIKQMQRAALQTAPEYGHLAARVAGIVFLGTPHTGSGIADYAHKLGLVLRTSAAVRELTDNAAMLRDLNLTFRNLIRQQKTPVLVYFETQPTRGVRVVDEASSDPGLAGVTPVPVDANHLTLPKPETADFRVRQTIALLKAAAARCEAGPTESLIGEILTAPSDRLPFIGAKVREMLAKDPGDPRALQAQAMLKRMSKVEARGWALDRVESLPAGLAIRTGSVALGIAAAGGLVLEHERARDLLESLLAMVRSVLG